MNRIQKLFKKQTEKLIPFLTAGYPELGSTIDLVCAAADSGADMIEIGIPFRIHKQMAPLFKHLANKHWTME